MFCMSKTTEFPDMLNCFIKKMFQSQLICPAGDVRICWQNSDSRCWKNDGNIVYLFE